MTKVYTIREAIGELDAIRMEAITIAKKRDKELAALVSELASVMGWLARHVDDFESETISEILFDTDDGPVRRSELYGCDGKDDDDADNLLSLALQDMVDRFAPNDDGLSDSEIACAQRAREVLELSRMRKVRKK
jgi:hypothetical protein